MGSRSSAALSVCVITPRTEIDAKGHAQSLVPLPRPWRRARSMRCVSTAAASPSGASSPLPSRRSPHPAALPPRCLRWRFRPHPAHRCQRQADAQPPSSGAVAGWRRHRLAQGRGYGPRSRPGTTGLTSAVRAIGSGLSPARCAAAGDVPAGVWGIEALMLSVTRARWLQLQAAGSAC